MKAPEARVAQFIKGLDIGGIHGGADLFGLRLACALKNEGLDSSLCVFFKLNTSTEEKYLSILNACGVKTQFLQAYHGKPGVRDYLSGLARLVRLLKEEPIDILHSHFHTGTLIAVWLKLFGRAPHVVRTAHVDREWLRGWDSLWKGFLIRFFIFFLFPLLVDREAGVSSEAVAVLDRRWLARWMKKKATVIFNSIAVTDSPPPSQNLAEDLPWNDSEHFIVGSIGRLAEQKGFAYLLEAAPEILRSDPGIRFWIAGDGPLEASLREQIQHTAIGHAVALLGKRDDLPALLDQTDLFVSPSIYEGLPTVILESIAHHVPVVATDIPGTRDIIRDGYNGFLVPPRDPQALAARIIDLVQNPERRANAARDALETLKEFTIQRAAQKYRELYEEMR